MCNVGHQLFVPAPRGGPDARTRPRLRGSARAKHAGGGVDFDYCRHASERRLLDGGYALAQGCAARRLGQEGVWRVLPLSIVPKSDEPWRILAQGRTCVLWRQRAKVAVSGAPSRMDMPRLLPPWAPDDGSSKGSGLLLAGGIIARSNDSELEKKPSGTLAMSSLPNTNSSCTNACPGVARHSRRPRRTRSRGGSEIAETCLSRSLARLVSIFLQSIIS